MMDRFTCGKCKGTFTAPGRCPCGLVEVVVDAPVDKSVDTVDKPKDTVEISVAARLLHLLDGAGIVIVNKEQHDEAVAARYYLARITPLLDNLLERDITVLGVIGIVDELRRMKAGGWF